MIQAKPEKRGPVLVFEFADSPAESVQGSLFAIAARDVMHVVEPESIESVPLAPALVHGIMNHHGRIITIIDPAVVLGLDKQPSWVGQAVLLRSSEGSQDRLGIQVRRVREMVNEEALEEVDVPHGPCVAWTAKIGRNLIHVIDRKQLMDGVQTYFATPLETRSARDAS